MRNGFEVAGRPVAAPRGGGRGLPAFLPLAAAPVLALLLCGAVPAGEVGATGPTGVAGDEGFTFVVYGDTRSGHDHHRKLMPAILRRAPQLVFNTGDAVSEGADAGEWGIYRDITAALREAGILFQCLGNHDLDGDFAACVKNYFETYPYWPEKERFYYSLARGDCLFLVLDDQWERSGTDAALQFEFVERVLRESDAQWKFVFFHESPYSTGDHGRTQKMDAYQVLFDQYGVDIVFTGHNHLYQRTHPVRMWEYVPEGTVYIVTGGGGAALDNGKPDPDMLEASASVNHYCLIRVVGSTLRLEAFSEDDEVIDVFEKTKAPPGAKAGPPG